MTSKRVPVETTAQAYVELLRERGIEYFFANARTDFAPLIGALARFAREGKHRPKPVTVPHENAAVAMAHGDLQQRHVERRAASEPQDVSRRLGG